MRYLALSLALLLPAEALAQNQVALPQGCTGYLTVQAKGCSVSHHFTCEGDAEGVQRRIDIGEGGPSYFGAVDGEAQWIESFFLQSNHAERLEEAPADRASISELMETGLDSYDFQTLSDEIGTTRYVGFDSLTGEQVEIDGVVLDRTNYQIRATDVEGNELFSSQGQEFISREFRIFFSGLSHYTLPDGEFDSDETPVEFIFPDEPGFLSPHPKYECGATISSFVLGGQ